jgi:hypothetical protein
LEKLLKFGVNVNKKEIKEFGIFIPKIKYLHEMSYLPSGAEGYDNNYGVKKYKPDEVDMGDIGF